jgi:hypothetical protein
LREQAASLDLDAFSDVVVLGGKEYQVAVQEVFAWSDATLHFPFAGLPLGLAMAATNEAVAKDDPFFRMASTR